MSAYIVDRATIHALVHAASCARSYSAFSYWHDGTTHSITGDHDRIGQMLNDANVRSVRARYPDCTADDLPGRVDCEWATPYVFPLYDSMRWPTPAPAFVLKQLSCFEYQACEAEDWATSEAHSFCDALRHALISQLPGYDAAPWGVDEYPVRAKAVAR